MGWTKGRVDPAQNDLHRGLQFAHVFNDLLNSRIPVGHESLNQDGIEPVRTQETAEFSARPPKPAKIPRNIGERLRLRNFLAVIAPPPPRISFSRNQEIEKLQAAAMPHPACNAKQSIRTKPKIVGGEVVYRRINEKHIQ